MFPHHSCSGLNGPFYRITTELDCFMNFLSARDTVSLSRPSYSTVLTVFCPHQSTAQIKTGLCRTSTLSFHQTLNQRQVEAQAVEVSGEGFQLACCYVLSTSLTSTLTVLSVSVRRKASLDHLPWSLGCLKLKKIEDQNGLLLKSFLDPQRSGFRYPTWKTQTPHQVRVFTARPPDSERTCVL